MDAAALRALLEEVQTGSLPVAGALARLRAAPPGQDLGFAMVDHHRELRQGFPEVIYAPGKTAAQLVRLAEEIYTRSHRVLVTRVDAAQALALQEVLPGAVHHEQARAVSVRAAARKPRGGIAIVSAGTADQPVTEEARVTCAFLDQEAEMHPDVGVAGLHRLMGRAESLQRARAIICVAGMEGALASVVGGLVGVPVVAVPTSVGYGTSFGGLAPLLAMLNSCAPNVCCVNIDDGFGAAVVASLINSRGPG